MKKQYIQGIFVGLGAAVLVTICVSISLIAQNVYTSITEFRQNVTSQVTIQDIRRGLDVIENQQRLDELDYYGDLTTLATANNITVFELIKALRP